MSQTDKDRLQYYSRKVKSFIMSPNTHDPQVHPSTYIRFAQLQPSALFPSLRRFNYDLGNRSISYIFLFLSPLLESLVLSNIRGFENIIVGPFLAAISSQMLSKIVLQNGRMSADILKKSIAHFKHLRSAELSDAVIMSDFGLWEVLGTLPSLKNLTLKAVDPASHPAHARQNSNSQSGGRKYFDALESLSVTGSFFFIQHLLSFINSLCLKSIYASPVIKFVRNEHEHEPEDPFTPSMMIIASKWSQSLKKLVINLGDTGSEAISKSLMLLTDLHEIQTFHLYHSRMGNMDDDVRRLVMSWPKLRTLSLLPLNQTFISLSTLTVIAETCPELRYLRIPLDTSTIPPFDTFSKSLRHNLEVLTVLSIHPASTQITLECQIQVTRYLHLIFPFLKSILVHPNNVTWSGIRDLVKLCQDSRLDK